MAQAGKDAAMGGLTRRSVLEGSLAFGAAGALTRPYILNAAAATVEEIFAKYPIQQA